MLSFENKIDIFKNILAERWNSYGDFMKDEIYFYFFENENSLEFLKELKSESEIKYKIEFLISKMIMHEHEDGLSKIIEYYI